jgi:hypothetical protein
MTGLVEPEPLADIGVLGLSPRLQRPPVLDRMSPLMP